VAAVCEEGSDQVELLSAGHGPIFVYSSDNQSFQLLDAQALPLGILPDLWDAVPVKLSLKPGDIVLLITDGFLEWENSAGEKFGTERLAAALRQFSHREPEVIIAELYDSVLNFTHNVNACSAAPAQPQPSVSQNQRSSAPIQLNTASPITT